jgi:hypothetical protein
VSRRGDRLRLLSSRFGDRVGAGDGDLDSSRGIPVEIGLSEERLTMPALPDALAVHRIAWRTPRPSMLELRPFRQDLPTSKRFYSAFDRRGALTRFVTECKKSIGISSSVRTPEIPPSVVGRQ